MPNKKARLQILGCGTSTGVPVPACACKVCLSGKEKNQRLRSSVLIRLPDGSNILIDATPDLRQQALRSGLKSLDAVLFTHAHADHILGIDDLRCYSFARIAGIPCYATSDTWREIRRAFSYLFEPEPEYEGGELARIAVNEIQAGESFVIGGTRFQAFPLQHGRGRVTGYRIGTLAYATDCNAIGPESEKLLQGIEIIVLDGLRETAHKTHFTIDQAIEAAARLGVERTFLTHMTHSVDYDEVSRKLPAGVALAYDGLEIEFDAEI